MGRNFCKEGGQGIWTVQKPFNLIALLKGVHKFLTTGNSKMMLAKECMMPKPKKKLFKVWEKQTNANILI